MQPWTKRTVIRATFATILVLLGALGVAIDGGFTAQEVITILTVTVGAAASWFGVGSQSSSIEPFFNNTEPGSVEVPRPPAVVERQPTTLSVGEDASG